MRAGGLFAASQGFVLGWSQGDDGKPAYADEGGIGEEFRGFDLIQGDRLHERLSRLNLDSGILWIGGVHGNDGGRANGAPERSSFVDDQAVAGPHLAKVFDGDGIGNAVPKSDAITLKIGEGVFRWFSLKQIVHGDDPHPFRRTGPYSTRSAFDANPLRTISATATALNALVQARVFERAS